MIHTDVSRLCVLDSVLGALNVGTVVLDHTRSIVVWNRWMVQHSGMPREQVIGQDFFQLYPELAGKRIDSAVQQALRDNFPSVLSQTLHKAPLALFASQAARAAGERIQQAVAVTPIEITNAPRHCLIQISDVSFAVNRERLLRDQALELRSQTFSDGLTGIANRRHFDVAMEKETRRSKRAGTPLSLLMIDIDSFKAYNDHYGHQHGDETLIRVATALAEMLQRPLDLIARYGGEEFAVILPEMDAGQSMALAESMRLKVAGLAIEHSKSTQANHVTVSIGVATHVGAELADIAYLVGAADKALYAAKRTGRNRVVMHAEDAA